VDSAEIQPELEGSLASADVSLGADESMRADSTGLPDALLGELWRQAEGERIGLTETVFAEVLSGIGTKYNYGVAAGEKAGAAQRTAFYRALHVRELALAHACARGHELAWQVFLREYQAALTRAAIAMTHSSGLGEDLAGSLYSELFGMTERDGVRRSPLASYSGRGSLMGWLRTMLAQRHVDHHRRTHRETPLEQEDFAAQTTAATPDAGTLTKLGYAVNTTLRALSPEERFLLSAYFLDGSTLLQIARLLRVHEATVSRKLKRLATDVRKKLLKQLERSGMSRRAAEEALGTDPRDVSVNLRNLLQTSSNDPFSKQTGER
jgi:RNA polymerase sigma-70 factor (ECF subfamily)